MLEAIGSPADLERLDDRQLAELCDEIRAFLVSSVAGTGGHLGPNLGVVELTVALHRVFDSPRDVLLWDTGHQAYVHKLLTGRRHAFARLRQQGGLCGYPSRAESPHDWVENSHASTALSYAYGLASAAAVRPGSGIGRVVAVVGDGALTGGMAYEALNNLGYSRLPATIVLNDNGRSYAPTVSRLSPRPFFEALGVRYTGPFDGHDIAALERALGDAGACDGPVAVHVRTRKGRGYPPAEQDQEKHLHDVKPFDPAVGPTGHAGAPKYTDVFSQAVLRAGHRDPAVVAVTAAMPGSTGLLPFRAAFPDRFVDVGIAEQHAVTAAAGMAMGGLRPVVAIYSTFLSRAFDQLNLDVGLHSQPVVLCVDRAGITGPDGPSHHGVLDMALLTKVPGMTVLVPSSAQELEVMFDQALATTTGPCALRWPSATARQVAADQVGEGLRARRLLEGDDVCVLAVGRLVEEAERAAGLLVAEGLSASVWDVRVAAPLDRHMLVDAARHRMIVTAEDGIRRGGVGSAIADAVAALDESHRSPPVLVLGTPVAYIPHGRPQDVLSQLGLDAAGIAAAALKAFTAGPVPAAPPARVVR